MVSRGGIGDPCFCAGMVSLISASFHFQFFEVLRGLRNCSLELRNTESRNESFWDGLGLEIDGARARFFLPTRNIPPRAIYLPIIPYYPLLNPTVALTKLPCRGPWHRTIMIK